MTESSGRPVLTVDFTNFTHRALGLGRGLLEEDLEKMEKIAPRVSEAVLERRRQGDLAWLGLHEQDLSDVLAFARSVRGRYDDVAVLGIGGSALGLIALHTALSHPFHNLLPPDSRGGAPRLFVFDNIDPFVLDAWLSGCDPARTLFFVISKSGTTAETMSQYLVVREMVERAGLDPAEHIVAITDPENGELRKIARRDGLTAFPIPPGVGGRFSVLTPVGLAPAAAVGMDVEGLLAGAGDYVKAVLEAPLADNPSLWLACSLFLLYLKGYRNHVVMPYSSRLRDVADWYRQLWAESLGKRLDRGGRVVEVGPTPIKALGVTDQHSQVQLYVEGPRDKAFVITGVKDHGRTVAIPAPAPDSPLAYLGGHTLNELMAAEMTGTIVALTDAGRPNCLVEVEEVSPAAVAQLFMLWELAVAYMGELLDINAYDQPGVEAGKRAAYALMGRPGFEAEAERIERSRRGSGITVPRPLA